MINPVAIIGNGTSRKTIDLKKLNSLMPIYGCNALYREYHPDMLFAIDDGIIGEIISSNFPKDRFFVPNIDDQYEPAVYNPNRPRENTGMIAMRYAISKGYNQLNCFGLDFLIDNPNLNMGNVFEGTNGYGESTRASVIDCINRTAYFDWFIGQNPNIEFSASFPEDIIQSEKFRIAPKENFNYTYF